MKNYAISRLNKRGTVGKMEYGTDVNGVEMDTFKPQFPIFYGEYQMTSELVELSNPDNGILAILVVRHNPKIEPNTSFIKTQDGTVLKITSIQRDSSVNGLDLITVNNDVNVKSDDDSSDDSE